MLSYITRKNESHKILDTLHILSEELVSSGIDALEAASIDILWNEDGVYLVGAPKSAELPSLDLAQPTECVKHFETTSIRI